MPLPARILVLCLSSCLAVGCEASDEGEGDDENAGTEESGEGTESGETGESSEATDTDEGLIPWEEYQALCEQQGSREACEAVQGQSDDEIAESQWCVWVVEVPTQLDGDACVFGAPTSECRATHAGEVGCASGSLGVCSIEDLGWSRMDGDALVVGRGALCDFPSATSCTVLPDLEVIGVPECACLCDPGFPL